MFKTLLSDRERKDYEGPGTRSFHDQELRWRDPEGRVHACEAAETAPTVTFMWTLCLVDLPADANCLEESEVDCPECLSVRDAAEPRARSGVD